MFKSSQDKQIYSSTRSLKKNVDKGKVVSE